MNTNQLHTRFNLSQLLGELAPTSEVTTRFAVTERAAHPDFPRGDRDGLLSRIEVGWRGEDPSPISAEEMLTWNPQEALGQLIDALSGAQFGEPYAILGAIQHAAKTSLGWGLGIFSAACSADESDARARLLESTAWGLREADGNSGQRIAFLRLCTDCGWPVSAAQAISLAIEHWARLLDGDSSDELLNAFDRAADQLFSRSTELEPGASEVSWFQRAINHPAGRGAEIWWMVADARDKRSGEFVLSIDEDERRRWERAVSDASAAGAFARPIVGQAIERLSAGDFPWATEMILPAFDAGKDRDRAAQMWDGRLKQTRWSWSVVIALEPYWDTMLELSEELLPQSSRDLGDVMAMLIAGIANSGFSIARLHRFILHASLEARQTFAHSLAMYIPRLAPSQRRELWRLLLQRYWADRRTGMPRALEPDELGEMLKWVAALPEVEDEVLRELEATPALTMEQADSVLWEWREDDAWIRAHPIAAVAIVRFIAKARSLKAWSVGDACDALEAALDAGAPHQAVIAAAQEVVAAAEGASARALEMIRRLSEQRNGSRR